MKLTDKELEKLHLALKIRKREKLIQPLLFFVFIVALFGLLFNYLSLSEFLYLAVPCVFFAVHLSGIKNYHEILEILENQLKNEKNPN